MVLLFHGVPPQFRGILDWAVFLYCRVCFKPLAWMKVHYSEQRLCNGYSQSTDFWKKKTFTIFLFTHFKRKGDRFVSCITFILLQGDWCQYSELQIGTTDVGVVSRYHLLTVGQTQIAAFLMVKNPCLPWMPDIRCLGKSFIISHFVIRFEV